MGGSRRKPDAGRVAALLDGLSDRGNSHHDRSGAAFQPQGEAHLHTRIWLPTSGSLLVNAFQFQNP